MYDSRLKMYVLLLKYMLLGFICFNGVQKYGGGILPLAFLIACSLLLAVNDTARRSVRAGLRGQAISLALSIAGAALVKYLVPGIGATVYIFVPLFELFVFTGVRMRLLFAAHAVSYFAVLALADYPFQSAGIADVGTSTLLYLGVACMSYLLHANGREKEEIQKLNEELSESNKKLMQYARQAEELAVVAERSRVAQELHDSLEHSLMALFMHVDVAEKISASGPDQLKAVLARAKDLSKKSAEELRSAVDALQSDAHAKDLAESIAELAGNMAGLEGVNMQVQLDSGLEAANADVKNCIYKTVREALTNGITHGSATFFTINAHLAGGAVHLQIRDNGMGCPHIKESTGLRGIRERVAALGGSVLFQGKDGFEITAQIPVAKEAAP